MPVKEENETSSPHPPETSSLEPFATVFLEIAVTEAVKGGWFAASQIPPPAELDRISRRIEDQIEMHLGRRLHPAIWVHALLVCGLLANASDPKAEQSEQSDLALDAALSLLQSLKLHHGLYELYLLTY